MKVKTQLTGQALVRRQEAGRAVRASRLVAATFAALVLLGTAPAAFAVCGNGIVEAGETCDDGAANGQPGDCCDATCHIEPGGSVCRPAAGTCDVPETCDGISPTCPADAFQPATFQCRPPAGVCDVAENCDGI